MSDTLERSLSSLSSNSQPEEDWDRSLLPPEPSDPVRPDSQLHHTPRNSIIFPADDTPGKTSSFSSSHTRSPTIDGSGKSQPKRTLSELLRLHSEKGSNGKFSAEEALRIADVLGQWINASSSPYEGEDDFFLPSQSQDDISVASKRPIPVQMVFGVRPRGRSESATQASSSRPPSSTGFVPS